MERWADLLFLCPGAEPPFLGSQVLHICKSLHHQVLRLKDGCDSDSLQIVASVLIKWFPLFDAQLHVLCSVLISYSIW